MAVTVDKVIVELEARMAGYERRLTAAEKQFDKSTNRMQQNALRASTAISRSFLSIGAAFGVAFGGTLLAGMAAGLVGIADKAKQLEAQLRLATQEVGSFGRATEDVRRISAGTRSGLEETAKLYSTFMRAANELGITQTEAARATESVSKAFIISGGSAVEAAQGTRQLIQAIQSGTLRGDEFNTIMEQAPRLAKLIADSMEMPVKALRGLAEQGKISADQLLAALTQPAFTAKLDEEFKKMPVTFDQAMQQISNAALITFSAFDRGGEFSKMLVEFVMGGAENFADLERRAEIMGGNLRSTIEALYNVFDPFGENAVSVMGIIEDAIMGVRVAIGEVLRDMQYLANWAPNNLNGIRRALGRPEFDRANFSDRFQQGLVRGDRAAMERRVSNWLSRADWRPVDIFGDERGNKVTLPPKAKTGGRRKSRGKSKEQIELEAERELERFQKDVERLNRELLQAKAATATAAKDVAAFEIQTVEQERQANIDAVQRAATGKDRRYNEQQAAELTRLYNEIAQQEIDNIKAREADRQAAENREINIARVQNEKDLAEAGAKLLDTRQGQMEAALRILDLQYEIERLELESIRASSTATDAQKAIAEERLKILGALKAADQAEIGRQNRSPAQAYLEGLNMSPEELNDAFENIAIDGLEAFTDGLTDAIMQTRSLKEVFREMAESIIRDLIRIAIQQLVVKQIAETLFGASGLFSSLFGGGGGSLVPTTGGLPGVLSGKMGMPAMPFRASGGNVVGGKTYAVGERGIEIFRAPQSGTIIPNGQLRPASAEPVNPGRVQIMVQGSELFDVRVVEVAGPVAAEVVRQSAPALTDLAAAKTRVQMGRPKM